MLITCKVRHSLYQAPHRNEHPMGQPARKRAQYPEHEHADQHLLFRDFQSRKRPTVRDAAKMRPCGEVACERIRELAWDIGAEKEWKLWMASVSERLGLSYATAIAIFKGEAISVTNRTVDKVSRATGIPVVLFYDPDA